MLKFFNISAKIGRFFIVLILSLNLSGCWISSIFTGAGLIYDRHNFYIKLNDYQISGKINTAIYKDKMFKCKTCSIEIAVFNLDVLMVGSVPTNEMRIEAVNRINAIPGKRRFYNQLRLSNGGEDPLFDSWITGNIRSKILANSSIDPHKFKIVTSNKIVYIMGDVRKKQAKKVILYARETSGVTRVVKLLRYFKYTQ